MQKFYVRRYVHESRFVCESLSRCARFFSAGCFSAEEKRDREEEKNDFLKSK